LIIVFWGFLNQIHDSGAASPVSSVNQKPGNNISSLSNQANPSVNNTGCMGNGCVVGGNMMGAYKNGTYSASSQTPWGNFGISISVVNGRWDKINFDAIPQSPPSRHAANSLAAQALVAQNQNIDGVSGATYASNAFRDDLGQIVNQSKK